MPRISLHQFRLDPPEAGGASLISDAERRRAAEFATPLLAARFVARRAALRRLLAERVGVPAGSLRFETGPRGKPALVYPRAGLHFSTSSREGDAIIAIADVEVGVDLEPVRPVPELEAIMAAHFGPLEHRALVGLTGASRDRAFLQCWTRKEALVKAIGVGLDLALPSLETGDGRDDPRLVQWDGRTWVLRNVDLGSSLVCALAVAVAGASADLA